MKRLRHPVRAIREPFGTAGLIVACIALVLGLTGAAFAAAKLNGTQKKEVEKIAKKFAGKPGAPGATGPAGPAGAAGAQGPKGDAGANGSNGSNGTDGVSPTGTNFSGSKTVNGVTCTEGGIEYKGASTNAVCNGKKGEKGSPWTAGGTLPSEATETGAWFVEFTGEGFAPISFPVPLSASLPASKTKIVNGTAPAECDNGTGAAPSVANPEADPGYLCVFGPGLTEGGGEPVVVFRPSFLAPAEGADTTGALILVAGAAGLARQSGTFAVTAP